MGAAGLRRASVVPIHNARGNVSLVQSLAVTWADKSPKEAHDVLALPDVHVTNQKDKQTLLPIIYRMHEEVQLVASTRDALALEILQEPKSKHSGMHSGNVPEHT